MERVLAFDIGGTKLSYCLVDRSGEIASDIVKVSTPKTSEEICAYLKSIISKYENDIVASAVATAGAVNKENTRVASSTFNLPAGYSNIDFSALSSKPVFVENDANAAAWAEFKIGKAQNYDNAIILTIGTGVGGGIIVEGKLLRGSGGFAGEVGSMKVSFDKKRICTCGKYDCWESYASGTGLKTTAEEIARNDEIFKSSLFASKLPSEVTTYDIIEGLKQSDAYSKKVFETWQYYIYYGTLSLTNIFNPDIVIFSGGLGDVLEIEKMQKDINENSVVGDIKIEKSALKNNIGMVGAALLAFDFAK